MNRRNAIRALLFGAPAAAIGMVSAPSFASAGKFATGDLGPELVVRTIGRIDVPVVSASQETSIIARAMMEELRRALPEAIERHNRNPYRRAG